MSSHLGSTAQATLVKTREWHKVHLVQHFEKHFLIGVVHVYSFWYISPINVVV